MQKPSGFDEAREGGFTPVELGGHYAIIKQVTETQSSTGKDMIVVLFDFDKSDKQPGYHSAAFQNDTRDERKWPFNGSKYIMVNDYNDSRKTSRAFKTFCSCVEKSNNCQIQWGGSNWGSQFKNKRIGVVYREEENEYNGEVYTRHNPCRFCSWDAVPTQRVPEAKRLAPSQAPRTPQNDAFMNVPAGVKEEEGIPF